jgi:hypothetical protein
VILVCRGWSEWQYNVELSKELGRVLSLIQGVSATDAFAASLAQAEALIAGLEAGQPSAPQVGQEMMKK